MKRFLLISLILIESIAALCQAETVEPPYKRFPTIPPFRLLLADSTTIITKDDLPKKNAVMIMLFSPDCEHCQHEASELVKNKARFKNIQVVMSTTHPFYQQQEFYNKYHLNELDNLIMGKDYQYILPSFFSIKNFPYIALYNKKKELITTFEGAYPVDTILQGLQ